MERASRQASWLQGAEHAEDMAILAGGSRSVYGSEANVHLNIDFASLKAAVVEGVGLLSLALSGIGALLIEVWGTIKIWQLIRGR